MLWNHYSGNFEVVVFPNQWNIASDLLSAFYDIFEWVFTPHVQNNFFFLFDFSWWICSCKKPFYSFSKLFTINVVPEVNKTESKIFEIKSFCLKKKNQYFQLWIIDTTVFIGYQPVIGSVTSWKLQMTQMMYFRFLVCSSS